MPITTELRWFYAGSLPDSVQAWFFREELGPEPHASPPRQDRYLSISGCDYLNLKLREGRFEVKLRQAQLQVLNTDLWEGQIERWMKWSCEDAAFEDASVRLSALPLSALPLSESQLSESQPSEPRWITVEKQRSQRFYQATPEHIQSLDEPMGDQGCSVEITQLTVHGMMQGIAQESAWWSLALEASGPLAQQEPGLRAIAQWLSQTEAAPTLDLSHTSAYPQWLFKFF